jgi:hypothetical protein
MRILTAALAGAVLFGLTAYGQDTQRVYLLTKTTAPGGVQEIAWVLRTVAGVKTLTVDSSSLAITLTAPSAVVAMTDWLVPTLDRYPLDSPGGDKPAQFTVPGGQDDMIEVYQLANIRTPQSTQEILTALREVGQMRKIFGVYAPRLVAFRGTSSAVAMADWLTRQLDIAPGTRPAGKPEYNPPAGDAMQVFYLANLLAGKDLVDIVTAVRKSAGIRYAFYSSSAPQSISVRGTPSQIAAVAQIIAAKDIPGGH